MTEIMERLCKFEYITVVIFPEDVILNEPVEKWPLCDCLISFHSKGNKKKNLLVLLLWFTIYYRFFFNFVLEGFPLDKAVSYAELRKPLLINDLNMQYFIKDR